MTNAPPVPGDHLAARARRTPDHIAVIDLPGGTVNSFADEDATVETLAGRLAAEGVTVNDRVATVLDVGVRPIRMLQALTRIGSVAVPLDPRLDADALADRVSLADPSLVVCDRSSAAGVAEIPPDVPIRTLDAGTEFRALPDPTTPSSRGRRPDEERLLVFTSGSTGRPKLVRLTARNLRTSAIASALRLGIDRDDRWYSPLPPWHVGGLAPSVRSVLYGTTVVVPGEFDAALAIEHIRETEVTCLSVVPTMLRRLLAETDGADALAAPGVRFVLSGGAPTPQRLVDRCVRENVPVAPTYGMTEAASQIATADPATAAAQPDSVGPPMWQMRVTIVDADGNPVDGDEPGEIVVDGPAVSPGYAGDPGTDTWGPYGFHTGDRGLLRDGLLYVRGRLDDRIVTGGETVDPTEIEAVLERHPSVSAAAVVGLEDPEWGERIGALVVTETEITPDDLARFYTSRLPGFKRPRTIALAAELPRTASGSIDRIAVRERLTSEP